MRFRVGNRVKYTGINSSYMFGMVGIIVNNDRSYVPYLVCFTRPKCNTLYYWCKECNITPLPAKNRQLLFSFMEQ